MTTFSQGRQRLFAQVVSRLCRGGKATTTAQLGKDVGCSEQAARQYVSALLEADLIEFDGFAAKAPGTRGCNAASYVWKAQP